MALAKIITIAELSHRQRNIVRGVAIRAWEDSGNDADLSIVRLSERLPHSFGTIYQPAAVMLGARLVRHWSTRKITEPQAVFVAGEPGCSEDQ